MDLRWQQDTFQLIREYLVLVHGEVLISSLSKSSKETFPNEHGDLVLEDRLEEVPGGSRISSIGRPSRSILRSQSSQHRPIPDASAGFTLLVIRIVTGRRHQIRVQLAGRGHPVVGDARYGNPDAQICSRLFLHRHRLSFWSGDELISVTEPLPEDLVEVLHTLEVSDQMDPIDLSDLSKDMVTLPSLCSKELLRPGKKRDLLWLSHFNSKSWCWKQCLNSEPFKPGSFKAFESPRNPRHLPGSMETEEEKDIWYLFISYFSKRCYFWNTFPLLSISLKRVEHCWRSVAFQGHVPPTSWRPIEEM